jgi:hypothetical protein
VFTEDKTDEYSTPMNEKYHQIHLLDSFLDAISHGGHISCIINTGEWQVFPREGACQNHKFYNFIFLKTETRILIRSCSIESILVSP